MSSPVKFVIAISSLLIILLVAASSFECALADYSETRSFRDALEGRSVEETMMGPVDRDTSSYGDRNSPPSGIPANGNMGYEMNNKNKNKMSYNKKMSNMDLGAGKQPEQQEQELGGAAGESEQAGQEMSAGGEQMQEPRAARLMQTNRGNKKQQMSARQQQPMATKDATFGEEPRKGANPMEQQKMTEQGQEEQLPEQQGEKSKQPNQYNLSGQSKYQKQTAPGMYNNNNKSYKMKSAAPYMKSTMSMKAQQQQYQQQQAQSYAKPMTMGNSYTQQQPTMSMKPAYPATNYQQQMPLQQSPYNANGQSPMMYSAPRAMGYPVMMMAAYPAAPMQQAYTQQATQPKYMAGANNGQQMYQMRPAAPAMSYQPTGQTNSPLRQMRRTNGRRSTEKKLSPVMMNAMLHKMMAARQHQQPEQAEQPESEMMMNPMKSYKSKEMKSYSMNPSYGVGNANGYNNKYNQGNSGFSQSEKYPKRMSLGALMKTPAGAEMLAEMVMQQPDSVAHSMSPSKKAQYKQMMMGAIMKQASMSEKQQQEQDEPEEPEQAQQEKPDQEETEKAEEAEEAKHQEQGQEQGQEQEVQRNKAQMARKMYPTQQKQSGYSMMSENKYASGQMQMQPEMEEKEQEPEQGQERQEAGEEQGQEKELEQQKRMLISMIMMPLMKAQQKQAATVNSYNYRPKAMSSYNKKAASEEADEQQRELSMGGKSAEMQQPQQQQQQQMGVKGGEQGEQGEQQKEQEQERESESSKSYQKYQKKVDNYGKGLKQEANEESEPEQQQKEPQEGAEQEKMSEVSVKGRQEPEGGLKAREQDEKGQQEQDSEEQASEAGEQQQEKETPKQMQKGYGAAMVAYPPMAPSQQQPAIKGGANYGAAPMAMAEPFAFGYKVDDNYGNKQYRKESGNVDGAVKGSYGYQDQSGIYRHVEYVADENGFRAAIKSNEPGLTTPAKNSMQQATQMQQQQQQQQQLQTPMSSFISAQMKAPTMQTGEMLGQHTGLKMMPQMAAPVAQMSTDINPEGEPEMKAKAAAKAA